MKVSEAIYCWNPETGAATFVKWPDVTGISGQYPRTGGAVYAEYREFHVTEQCLSLMVEAWQSVVRDAIPVRSAAMAMMVVDEIRLMLAADVS